MYMFIRVTAINKLNLPIGLRVNSNLYWSDLFCLCNLKACQQGLKGTASLEQGLHVACLWKCELLSAYMKPHEVLLVSFRESETGW